MKICLSCSSSLGDFISVGIKGFSMSGSVCEDRKWMTPFFSSELKPNYNFKTRTNEMD